MSPNQLNHSLKHYKMKKTFLFIAVLLMMGSTAFAGGGFDIAIGPKFGYQTASLSYDKADIKAGFSNHFTAGLFGRVTVGRVYVQPEVLYFKTSNVFSASVEGVEDENLFNLPTGAHMNLTLNQMNLQVPLMIGYNIIDLDIIKLRAQVGPTANFLLKSQTMYDQTYTLDGQQYDVEETATSDKDFDTKSIAWGVQAGLGVDVLNRITLDVNYNFGLTKMFDKLDQTPLGETFDFNNLDSKRQNMFIVTVGVKLL